MIKNENNVCRINGLILDIDVLLKSIGIGHTKIKLIDCNGSTPKMMKCRLNETDGSPCFKLYLQTYRLHDWIFSYIKSNLHIIETSLVNSNSNKNRLFSYYSHILPILSGFPGGSDCISGGQEAVQFWYCGWEKLRWLLHRNYLIISFRCK